MTSSEKSAKKPRIPGAKRELAAMAAAHEVLSKLDKAEQTRVLGWLVQNLGAPGPLANGLAPARPLPADVHTFLDEKQPLTDCDRVACLAYHLTKTLGQKAFVTRDLSQVNNAAQMPKFTNTTMAVLSALQKGILVRTANEQLALTELGVRYVELLPRRRDAVALLKEPKVRRGRKPRK